MCAGRADGYKHCDVGGYKMQTTLFDFMNNEDKERFAPKKSTDWKWTFSDYPKEKNGLKVFSCFACGGVAQWVTN